MKAFLVLLLAVIACPAILSAKTHRGPLKAPQVVAKARNHLGSEAALTSVQTLEYKGLLYKEGGTQPILIHLELKKPNKQRLTLTSNGKSEVYCCSGPVAVHEMWTEGSLLNQELLGPDQAHRLAAQVCENLFFYLGSEWVNQPTTVQGPQKYSGVQAYLLTTHYGHGIAYGHWIDAKTGQCLSVETAGGIKTVQEGTIFSGNIRFPQRVHVYKEGKKQYWVDFKEINVNVPMEDWLFEPEAFTQDRV